MGVIDTMLGKVFGPGGNVIAETAEIFRENAENRAERDAAVKSQALAQFAAEFAHRDRGTFDKLMDGVNRLPRPAMALGTLGLFLASMVSPAWFTSRMEGLAYVPDPLWWLLAAVVSFYFGARHQTKGQEFRRALVGSLAAARGAEGAAELEMREVGPSRTSRAEAIAPLEQRIEPTGNPALDEWRASR